jgi:hypothetical protein
MKLKLNKENIAQLNKEKIAPAISIYLQLSKTFADRKTDRIRLENLLKTAARQVISAGSDKSYARQLVEPGFVLARDHFFWKTKAQGLALFIIPPRIIRYIELPAFVQESVRVGRGFDLAQLRQALDACLDFFVLAASKNDLSFYESANCRLKKILVRGLPKNVKSFLPDKTFEKKLQMHGASPRGKRELIHGQGVGGETHKVLLFKYFKAADGALHPLLAGRKDILVFAGDEGLFPIFRKANTYPHLLKAVLNGNFENIPPNFLYEKALQLLKNAPP